MDIFQKKFKLSEFNRIRMSSGELRVFEVPFEVQEKILNWIFFLNPIRFALNHPIFILTGYRPLWHEEEMGRDGSSQHVFKISGAVDLRAGIPLNNNRVFHDFLQFTLAKLLLDYKVGRIIYYPQPEDGQFSFFHIDFKEIEEHATIMLVPTPTGLTRVTRSEFLQKILNGGS